MYCLLLVAAEPLATFLFFAFSLLKLSRRLFHFLCNLVTVTTKNVILIYLIYFLKNIICFRYLGTGCSFEDFELSYHRGASTARKIVQETCQLIWNYLKAVCIPEPTQDMWKEIASGFLQNTNFPNCLGAIDGKHIRIIHPFDTGSLYFNYKKIFSIVLLASCDSNLLFTFVDVGAYGKASDSTIFRESELCNKIHRKTLNIPSPRQVGNRQPLNYTFVGDEAFGLSENMMRPYAGKYLDLDKKLHCKTLH